MALNDSSKNPAMNSSASASGYDVAAAKLPMARHHSIASRNAVRAWGGSKPRLSSTRPATRAPAASAASSML